MGDLEDQHKIFLQAFMWKKICNSDEVRDLFKKCHIITNVESGDLPVFVMKINSALKPLNMAIHKGTDELTGESYYILINSNNNNISRLVPEYKVQELEVFKSITSSIVKSDDGKISSTDALNLEIEAKISKKEVNDMLQMFKKDGWLCEKEGYFFFSTRAIAELQHFFRENYADYVSSCELCKNIVFQGPSCNNCERKLHNHCKESYFTRSKVCPTCNRKF
ncbi:non-structural maintenance of chromosomes element 1 homolog [Trichonephila clavipes]|nr:non-structural maintenance of chromosomes element 1 homolog [Trichonephila clavipes]